MCPSLRIAAAAVLFAASAAHAQYPYGPPGRNKSTVVIQVRNGPFSSFIAAASYQGYGPYGYVNPWYYGPVPIYVPIYIPPPQPSPPVVIQNFVQPPPPIVEPGRPAFPAEFDPNPAKAAPKIAAKPGAKLGPAPKPGAPGGIQDPPRPAKVIGRADADRAVEAGRKAFVDGQYGRAAELFLRAAEIAPNEASIQFLMAQAYFALGKYREAVSAITAGIAVRPDWADARFESRDPYGKKPALFDDHLAALRKAVAAFPDDATLAFLLGHELWFDGKVDEARTVLHKAQKLGNDATPVGVYLK